MNLYLNSGQKTRLTVVLAELERDLFKLEKAFVEKSPKLKLIKFSEEFSDIEPESLKIEINNIRNKIAELTDDFSLEPMVESIKRNFLASLELNYINILECFPEYGLKNYGAVDSKSADILEQKLNVIKSDLLRVIDMINNSCGQNERSQS